MSRPGTIRVLVADDHPVVCMGLAAIIGAQADMSVVAQAADGIEAIQKFRKHQPDVTLMDLRMPNLSGVEAIRAIREEFPNSVFVVLTTFQGDEDIHRALMAGAQAYLLKGMAHGDLLEVDRKSVV